jgi:hypothetical protein
MAPPQQAPRGPAASLAAAEPAPAPTPAGAPLTQGQAQLAAVMQEMVRLLLARQDALLGALVQRAAEAPPQAEGAQAQAEGARARKRKRDAPGAPDAPPLLVAPEAPRPRAPMTWGVREIFAREVSAYLLPLEAYCLSLTCKEFVPIARRYNRDAAAARLGSEQALTSYAACKPLVSLITLQYALERTCSVCRHAYQGRFQGNHGVYAHAECARTQMMQTITWARWYGMMEQRGQHAGRGALNVLPELESLPGDERGRERDAATRLVWVLRDFCLNPKLTLSEQLRVYNPNRWAACYQAMELANANSHLCTLLGMSRVHRLKADLGNKEGIVFFGGGKRRSPLTDLVQAHDCWDIVSGDYLKRLRPDTSHAAVLARLQLLVRVVAGLRTRIAMTAKRELKEIAQLTGLTPPNEGWVTPLLDGTGFSLRHGFRLICENNSEKAFLDYFKAAAKARIAVLRTEYASRVLKLPLTVQTRVLACLQQQPVLQPDPPPLAVSREVTLRKLQSGPNLLL